MDLPKPGEVVPLEKIKEICRYFHLEELWEKIERNPPEYPFCSDGCSLWVDRWNGFDLYPACFKHDLKYWSGYPGEEVARLVADAELMMDVAKTMDSTSLAEIMFVGVRAAGGEWINASFSWGFGRNK
jgi:hypothetical protein